jgi:hypothetical protein
MVVFHSTIFGISVVIYPQLIGDVIKYLQNNIPDKEIEDQNRCAAAKDYYQYNNQNDPPNSRLIIFFLLGNYSVIFLLRHVRLLDDSCDPLKTFNQ